MSEEIALLRERLIEKDKRVSELESRVFIELQELR